MPIEELPHPNDFSDWVQLAYKDLKRQAQRVLIDMRHLKNSLSESGSELVDEYVLSQMGKNRGFENVSQFLAFSAHCMRCLLIDRARSRFRRQARFTPLKKGDDLQIPLVIQNQSHDAEAIYRALDRLCEDGKLSTLERDLFVFSQTLPITVEDLAAEHQKSRATVYRLIKKVRTMLQRALSESS